MPQRPTLAAVTLALAMLVPSATATQGWQADFTAGAVQAHGDSTLNATLLAFLEEVQQPPNGVTPKSGFVLNADHFVVQRDQADVTVSAAGNDYVQNPKTASQDYWGGSLRGVQSHSEYRFNVYALDPEHPPTFATATSCGQIDPAKQDVVVRGYKVKGNRQDAIITVPTNKSAVWQPCGPGGDLTVRGDLRITVWDWNVEAKDATRNDAYTTGASQSPYNPAGGPSNQVLSRRTELYVYAYDAALTIPLALNASQVVYAAAPMQVVAHGGLRFDGVSGNILQNNDAQAVQAKALLVEGDVAATIQDISRSHTMSLHVHGHPLEVQADGRDLEILGTAVQAPLIGSGLLWFAGLAITLGIAASAGYRILAARSRPLHERRQRRAQTYLGFARRLEKHPLLAGAMTRMANRLAPPTHYHHWLRLFSEAEPGRPLSPYNELRRAAATAEWRNSFRSHLAAKDYGLEPSGPAEREI